jgi:hypothetical protein
LGEHWVLAWNHLLQQLAWLPGLLEFLQLLHQDLWGEASKLVCAFVLVVQLLLGVFGSLAVVLLLGQWQLVLASQCILPGVLLRILLHLHLLALE